MFRRTSKTRRSIGMAGSVTAKGRFIHRLTANRQLEFGSLPQAIASQRVGHTRSLHASSLRPVYGGFAGLSAVTPHHPRRRVIQYSTDLMIWNRKAAAYWIARMRGVWPLCITLRPSRSQRTV